MTSAVIADVPPPNLMPYMNMLPIKRRGAHLMNFELSKEQRDFQRVVHDFVTQEVKPLAKQVDETGEFNWQAVRKMGPLGMLGLQVPEAYGGADLDTICATIAIEELGWACGSTALAVSAHNCLGQGPLVDFGAEEL
jgi:alkylation response protein AidB-like acyl-CoA dehydrogenase